MNLYPNKQKNILPKLHLQTILQVYQVLIKPIFHLVQQQLMNFVIYITHNITTNQLAFYKIEHAFQ